MRDELAAALHRLAADHRRGTFGARGRAVGAARRPGSGGARAKPQPGAALPRLPEPIDRRVERRTRPRSTRAVAPASGCRRHRSAGPRLHRDALRCLRAARPAVRAGDLAAVADAPLAGFGRRWVAADASATPAPRPGNAGPDA